MDLAKVYYDRDGCSGTILQIIKREPEWAANRIQAGERAFALLSPEQRRAADLGEPAPSGSTNTGSHAICAIAVSFCPFAKNYVNKTECNYVGECPHKLQAGV